MDDAVQTAKRAYLASGSVTDGGRWLAARVRAATITREPIALAWCELEGLPAPRALKAQKR